MKKTGRVLLRIAGGLVFLLCLAIGGALLWLRTEHGEKTVAALAVDVLAEQGVYLSLERLSGPLPSRLFLQNVRIADGKGEWFAAREVEVRLSLADLVSRTVAVPLVRVDTPELYRAPELPPSEEASLEDAAASGFSLPVSLRVDSIVIENAGIYAPLIFPEVTDQAGLADRPESPLLRASLRGSAQGEAFSPLTASAKASLAADIPQLMKLLQSGPLPVTECAVDLDAVVTLGQEMTAKATGTVTAEAWETPLAVTYSLDAALAGSAVTLREAVLDGLGLHLAATAQGDIDALTGKAEAKFTAADNGEWQKLLEKIAGQRLGGAFNLSADASLARDGKIKAALAVDGSALRWPVEQLQALLGDAATVRAKASGGGNAPYEITLETARAGNIAASGTALLSPSDDAVRAELTATLQDLAALAPDVHGALAAKAKVSGTLTAPVLALEAASDTVTTKAGVFHDLRANVSGDAALPADGAIAAQGRATLSLGQSPAGPVRLGAAYSVALAASGEVAARVHDADVALAGVSLTADVTAKVPAGEGALPSLDGKASAAILDWRPLAALTGVPLTGKNAALEAVFSHNAAGQTVAADIRADSLTLKDAADGQVFSLSGLAASLEAKDLAAEPDAALTVSLGKGAAGPFTWQTGALRLALNRGDGTFAVALRGDGTAGAALDGAPGAGEPVAVKMPSGKPANSARRARDPNQPGRAELLTAAGNLTLSPMAVTLNRLSARLPDSPLGVYLSRPAEIMLGDTLRVRDLDLRIVPGNGSVAAEAAFAANDAALSATVTELPFRLIAGLTGAPLPDGTASLSAALTKKGAAVQGTFDAKAVMAVPGVDAGTAPAVTVTVNGTLDDKRDPAFPHLAAGKGLARLKGRATVNLEKTASAGTAAPEAAVLAFNAPLRFSADGVPQPDMAAPLGATLAWKGDIAPVWALAPVADRRLSGLVQLDASLAGNLSKPEYDVKAYMGGGRFEDGILGILLTGIRLEAASSSTGESKIIARVEDGQGGFAALEGRLLLPEQAVRAGEGASILPRITARGQISHLQPLQRDDLFIRLSGRLNVDGELAAPKIAALMEVERGEISLLTSMGGVSTLDIETSETQGQAAASGPTCDIKVSVPNRFYIRGRGLDSEWKGNLAVSGPLSGPSLTGSLQPVRGSFDFLSRVFSFESGDITFFGGDRINPALNLALTYEASNITAVVRALGTAKKPDIRMESRPPLPQDQILSEVLFGKDFSNLSRFEALQVANSVRQLANIGDAGLDPLTSLRTSLGIDMLRVGSSGNSGEDTRSIAGTPGASSLNGGNGSSADGGTATPTVEAGKYINDAIYVGVEQGAGADSTGVRVEVELRPNVTLQGKTSTRSSEVGLGWKRDY